MPGHKNPLNCSVGGKIEPRSDSLHSQVFKKRFEHLETSRKMQQTGSIFRIRQTNSASVASCRTSIWTVLSPQQFKAFAKQQLTLIRLTSRFKASCQLCSHAFGYSAAQQAAKIRLLVLAPNGMIRPTQFWLYHYLSVAQPFIV